MKTELLKVSLRNGAVFISEEWRLHSTPIRLNQTSSVLIANCSRLGYAFSEELFIEINNIHPKAKLELFSFLKEVSGVNKNWTPLIKQWNIPTGESIGDHIITWLANVFKIGGGTTLPCGHTIPVNTFPLERYNGCPYCGTPFEFERLELRPTKNKLKVLELWNEQDLKTYLSSLLTSPVALDATQRESLIALLDHFGLPENTEIKIKETKMLVIDTLVSLERNEQAGSLFENPNDVLRFLWFNHTGFLQIIEPKTIARRLKRNSERMLPAQNQINQKADEILEGLKLKFERKECKLYANWLNNIELDVYKQCEIMHPKRGIWVRVIRALRLAEYSKKKGFDNLALLLDVFYNEKYEVWQGKVNHFKLRSNEEETFRLLKQRPGLFARSLFSSMLWFGPDTAIEHFKEVMYKVPPRLIFTLNMYAENYFDPNSNRSVKPLGGINKRIKPNEMLQLYSAEELSRMKSLIQELGISLIKKNFEKVENMNETIFIDDSLFNIPISIGDRSESVQNESSVLMGTKYSVEGDELRLFIQWGEGLRAQHLDMDLSCSVSYANRNEFCSYSQLVIQGCKHSGDIQNIPEKVGTAEYIDIDLNLLRRIGAKYVSFTCNAYTNGNLTPNMSVGWMNSSYPMEITPNGVAYDPSAVQHEIQIRQSLTKGLLFGVLEVETNEITWLEMAFDGRQVTNLDQSGVETLLEKLAAKTKIGDLLMLKSEVQKLTRVSEVEEADEVYDVKWASNSAEVSKMFLSE